MLQNVFFEGVEVRNYNWICMYRHQLEKEIWWPGAAIFFGRVILLVNPIWRGVQLKTLFRVSSTTFDRNICL